MVARLRQEQAMSRAKTLMQQNDDDLTPDAEDDLAPSGELDPTPEPPSEDEEMEVVDAALQGGSSRTVTILRHEVVFDLLNVRQEMQAYSLAKVSKETPAYDFALQTAYFALSVRTIDSVPFHTSIASDGSEAAERWRLAVRYYRPFIQRFFAEYLKARDEVNSALEALEK